LLSSGCVTKKETRVQHRSLPDTSLQKIALDVLVKDDDYIFLGTDSIAIVPEIKNDNKNTVKGHLSVKLLTDDYHLVKEETVPVEIAGNAVFNKLSFGLSRPAPGFYRYDVTFALSESGQINKKLNVGYEPEKIASPNDQQPDFDAFWQDNLKKLAEIAPDFQLTPLPEQSKLDYEMYEVTMRSWEDELI